MGSFKNVTGAISKLDNFNNWIRLLCILLAVAYVLSLGAASFWVFDLFRHFLLQYALLAVVFALLALARKLWPCVLAMIVLCGLCGYEIISRIDYIPPPTAEALAGPGLLKVITYNRHHSLTSHQEMVDFIKAENPDIFFILEANETHAEALKKDMKEAYPYQLLFPKENAFGMVAASRHPFKSKSVTFSQIIVKSGLKNFILIAKIQIKGFAPVSFYALHTPPPLRSWFFEQRNAELDHAASIINYNHKDRNSNIVLLGDWNITPYSPFFSRLLESTGFKNQTMSRFFLPTWPAQYYSFFQIPIDHILHRGNMTLIDKRRGPSLGSDHHAVVAVYQLEPDARKKNEP
jgi:endonuclease/exonuclease/phosphatase (EEP) superfamily protein YafD